MNLVEDRFNRNRISIMLVRFAWAVEIVAVIIGLMLAMLTAVTYFESAGTGTPSHYMNATVGTLPFIIVAMVEITKIPLTGAAFYARGVVWKVVFILALLFVALITFETMFNGLERFFNAQTSGVVEYKKKLVAVEEQIKDKNATKSRVQSVTIDTIEDDYNKRRTAISNDRNAQIQEIEDIIKDKRAGINTNYVMQLKEEKETLRGDRELLLTGRENRIKNISERFDLEASRIGSDVNSKRLSLQKEVAALRKTRSEELRNRLKESQESNVFTRSTRTEQYDQRITEINNRINEIVNKIALLGESEANESQVARRAKAIKTVEKEFEHSIDDLDRRIRKISKKISETVAVEEADIQGSIDEYHREIERIRSKFEAQEKENLLNRELAITILRDDETKVTSLNSEIGKLEDERSGLRVVINKMVDNTQVYRIATWWTGKESAADVDRQDVALTAFIWFGSLSAIAAFTGIILAAASYAVSPKFNEKDKRLSYAGKVWKTIRRFILVIRKNIRIRKTKEVAVEVIKEVPVDKIVFKEKPVEVVRKEITYVPMYTNDKELLGKAKEVT